MDGPIGWVISWQETLKTKHLQMYPYIWDLHKSIQEPLGFDPEPD